MSLTDHIAIAADFSELSRRALKGAVRLAELCSAKKVSVLYAPREVVLPPHADDALSSQLARVKSQVDETSRRSLEQLLRESCPGCQLAIDFVVVPGRVERVIPLKAKSIGATLLVLGTEARTGISRLVMGSVAEAVLRNSEVPTLLTPAGEGDRPPDQTLGSLTRILVAADLTRDAGAIVRAAMEGARSMKTIQPHVTILSVTDVPEAVGAGTPEVEALRAETHRLATEHLAKLAADFKDWGVPIETRVEDGEADVVIKRVAAELGVRLIAVGTHGRGYAKERDLGTTAAEIVRSARVSVLVVPTVPEARP